MLHRIAKVDALKVTSAGLSSTIQIGDSHKINSFTRAIAVQRQKELFFSNEADFGSYEIFSRSLPLQPLSEPIFIHSTSLNPLIKVNSIDVIGISAASVLHIGNSESIQMESRIKHIRQLESVGNTSETVVEEE